MAGTRSTAEVALGEWPKISDAAIEQYGDVIACIYNEAVAVYDCDCETHHPTTGLR
jgi:hypothetical protein